MHSAYFYFSALTLQDEASRAQTEFDHMTHPQSIKGFGKTLVLVVETS